MLNWILVQSEYGQLGNRLHTHANLLAFCIENKINFLNLSFSQYANLFEEVKGQGADRFIFKRDFLSYAVKIRFIISFCRKILRSDKWLRRLSPWIKMHSVHEDETINSTDLIKIISKNRFCRVLVLRDWNISCPDEIRNHGVKIKSILTPAASFRYKAESSVDKLRLEFDTLVGVHARRGDYKNYMSGAYFYPWEQYADWINQTREVLISEGAIKVGFLICSDEPTPKEMMLDLPANQTMPGNPIEDLHALSLCDYLMGPPSSFGTWASWYGDVPRLTLEADLQITNHNQFTRTLHC